MECKGCGAPLEGEKCSYCGRLFNIENKVNNEYLLNRYKTVNEIRLDVGLMPLEDLKDNDEFVKLWNEVSFCRTLWRYQF